MFWGFFLLGLHVSIGFGLPEVPSFYDPTLGFVDIFLVLHMFDAHSHSILGKDNVVLSHALRRRVPNLGSGVVHLVEDPSDGGDEDDCNEKRDEFPNSRTKMSVH